MKLILTGASSRVGAKTIELLQDHFEIFPIGRRTNEHPWQLGVELDPEAFRDAGAIIHFAWSMNDRKADMHLNIGGTSQLAGFAQRMGIPFIFISSIAAIGDSDYGRTKFEAERYAKLYGGVTIRIGLVVSANSHTERNSSIHLVPNLKGEVLISEVTDLSNKIQEILNELNSGKMLKQEVIYVISGSKSVVELFKKEKGLNVLIPQFLIKLILNVGSKFSIKIRNNQDAFKSLLSTLERH